MSTDTSDFAALLAVARRADEPAGEASNGGGRRRGRKRRRHHREHAPVVLNAATEFARFQPPDELDNVFSETCLVTLNLCDLIPEQNRYISRVRDGCAGSGSGAAKRGPGVSMVVAADERLSRDHALVPQPSPEQCDPLDLTPSITQPTIDETELLKAHAGPGVGPIGLSADLQAKLTCFAALWYQMSGGERVDDVLHSGNCLRADRREVLGVAAAFRFGADKSFRGTVVNALDAHRQKMDALLATLHMAKCKLGNHSGCDFGWGREISITTVNDVVAQAVQSVLDFCPSETDGGVAANDPVCANALVEVARQVWHQIQDAWIAALAVSTAVSDFAKDLYARVAFVAAQLQRVPRVPGSVYTAHMVQLYTLMFVRTFETLRQIGVNTMTLVHGATLEPWLRVAGEGDELVAETTSIDAPADGESDIDFQEHMDRYAESDEDNDVQRRVRRFLLGYSDLLSGDAWRAAAKASAGIDFQTETDCEELVALNETALTVFLVVRMLYYEPVTGRLRRFVASVDRAMAAAGGPTLRERKAVRQRLSVASDLYESSFLVRQIRDTLDRRCGGGGGSGGVSTADERMAACRANAGRAAGNALDANSLMNAIECDVGRLTDKQFQLNERQWDDCRQWIFTATDAYKFTYAYAVMSKLRRLDQLQEVRRVVSLYNQLLRVKVYRLVFERRRAPPRAASEPMDWEASESGVGGADADLASMYDTVESELRAQQQREQLVRGTLRRIEDLTATRSVAAVR